MKPVLRLRCLNDMIKRGSFYHLNSSSNYATFTTKSYPQLGLILPQAHTMLSTQCIGTNEIRRTMSYKTNNNIRPSAQNIVTHNPIGDDDDQATLPLDKPDQVAQHYTVGSHRSWKKLCQRFPELGELNQKQLIQLLEVLSIHGIPPDAGAEISVKYPAILNLTEASIIGTISALRNCGFSEEHRTKLLRKFPQVFDLHKSEFRNRIGFLNTYFENSGESLKAVMNSIEALTDTEYIVKRKLRYLIFDLAHATSSIKNCNVLSFPLQFMKIRHEFLIRAGIYVPIPYRKLIKVREKEKASKLPRAKYFKPEEVVCTSDKQFLKTCTRGAFTTNDLAAFEEIFLAHQDEEGLEEDGDIIEDDMKKMRESSDDEDDDDQQQILNSTGFGNKAEVEHFYF